MNMMGSIHNPFEHGIQNPNKGHKKHKGHKGHKGHEMHEQHESTHAPGGDIPHLGGEMHMPHDVYAKEKHMKARPWSH